MPLLTAEENNLATRAHLDRFFGYVAGNHQLVKTNAAFLAGFVALGAFHSIVKRKISLLAVAIAPVV